MPNLKSLLARDDAQSLVEYAILAGLVSLAALAALTLLGGGASTILNNVATALPH